MIPQIKTALGVCAFGVAVAGAWDVQATQVAHGSTAPSDQSVIKQLVFGSQLAEQTSCVAPNASATGERVMTLSPDIVAQVRETVARIEGTYYMGSQLTGMTRLLQQNCTLALTNAWSRMIAGGVGPMTCSTVSVNGDHAHATCQLVKWLRSVIRNGHGGVTLVQPSALTIVNDDLVRTNGAWRISVESFEPAPGQGP